MNYQIYRLNLMKKYDIEFLKKNELIIFECISGSHAYGTNTPESDIDKKGIFIMPKKDFYSLGYIEQVNDEKYDIVYYEIKKYIEMLLKSNPNALEILASSKENIINKNPIFDLLDLNMFLTKKCKDSFAGYAYQQIKKSRGDNKKIVNTMDEVKKTIYDFCYILKENKSVSLKKWIKENNITPEYCGLSRVDHAPDLYALYYDSSENIKYNGIIENSNSTTLKLTSIPKEEVHHLKNFLYYNEDGYKIYCKKYNEYMIWLKERNENRYKINLEHNKNYDSKNMSHCFRLIEIAQEIALNKTITLKSKNIDFLLKVKEGYFDYDYLINLAEEKFEETNKIYENSDIKESINIEEVEKILIELRERFYIQE